MKTIRNILLFSMVALITLSCAKVPITGRKQLKLLPNSTLLQLGESNYATFLKENPAVNPPTRESAEVSQVGLRVSQSVEIFMRDNGLSKNIEGYKWEFNVVDSKDINAWCMPGGKVVFYTGILPLTKDDAGIAVIMGHEIAHAIANHGNERMSQQLAVQLGGLSLALAMQQKPQQTQDIFLASYGVASTLGVLAYSRQHELEADKLGLIFMAMAGYNPERAVEFWQEMEKQSGSGRNIELLSTHPSDAHRIQKIKEFLPEALIYYNASPAASGTVKSTTKTGKETGRTTGTTPASNTPPKAPDMKKLGVKIK